MVAVQDFLGSGYQRFGHGIDADILVDGDPYLGCQRRNDRMFGGAAAHLFLKKDHQVLTV